MGGVLTRPLRLRSLASEQRKVTWLELFFDLIFVAAVSQVAEPLRHDYSVAGLVRFAPLFVLIWWAWTGQAVFATRFDTDDAAGRALTLVQMFGVAAMAANATDALDSRSSAGFAAAYAALRFILVAQYFRARHVRDARPLAMRYLAGHGIAAVLWLTSAFAAAPERFWLWTFAFAIDLGTPWLAVPHSVRVPPDAAHLPERFGLFTLILLGESVVAVMQGMESQEDWTPAAATSAFLGMGILFLVWWWYFDGVAGASERPVRNRRDALRFQVWCYAHFPLSMGIVIAGVGLRGIVSAASRAPLGGTESAILASAMTVVMLALSVIGWTSRDTARPKPRVTRQVMLAAITCALGFGGGYTYPVVLMIALSGLSLVQLGLSLRAPSEQSRTARRDSSDSGQSRALRGLQRSDSLTSMACASPSDNVKRVPC